MNLNFQLITEVNELKTVLRENKRSPEAAVDTETTGLSPFKDKIVGVSFSFDGATGYYVPLRHAIGANYPDIPEFFKIFFDTIMDKLLIFFNFFFDYMMCLTDGVDLWKCKVIDAQILCYLNDTNDRYPDLKGMAKKHLNFEMKTFEEVVLSKLAGFANIKPEDGLEYAASDAIATFNLKRFLLPTVQENSDFVSELDHKLLKSLGKLMRTPVPVCKAQAEGVLEELEDKINSLRKEIYEMAGMGEFKIDSPEDLPIALTNCGVPLTEMTAKSGRLSTKKDILANFMEYPIVKKISEYRSYVKSRGYVRNFVDSYNQNQFTKEQLSLLNICKDPEDFLLVRYSQVAVPTGRLASGNKEKIFFSKINLQQVTKNKKVSAIVTASEAPECQESQIPWVSSKLCLKACGKCGGTKVKIQNPQLNLRAIFRPYPGHVFVAADYDAQEAKMAAFLSNEPVWLMAIDSGGDLHKITASEVKGISIEQVEPTLRQMAKTTNYAILFGGSAYTIAKEMKIPLEEGEAFYTAFFNRLHVLKSWIEKVQSDAVRSGFASTIFGRRRPLQQYLWSNNNRLRGYGFRSVVSHMVQGSCGDIMRIAMVRMYQKLEEMQIEQEIIPVSTIHDELGLSVDPRYIKEADELLKHAMIFTLPNIDRKLTVSTSIGSTWGNLVEIPSSMLS